MEITYTESTPFSREELTEFLEFLKSNLQLDFTEYSTASVERRIARILNEFRCRDLGALKQHLIEKPVSRERFPEIFAVNVTEMFRDPFFYRSLTEKVFPRLARMDEIRIWSAGCSSGEEVLSLCILLHEFGLLSRSALLATDISPSMLGKARKRIIPSKNEAEYKNSYEQSGGITQFKAYYRKLGDDFLEFAPFLMEKVDFRRHNLVQEEAPGRFDLILCRNVFIYFNPVLQNRVFDLFTGSLDKSGFLALGAGESIQFCDRRTHFSEIDENARIYRKSR